MELISVIIPVYNTEKFLDRCITSAVGQSYENLEIILVNDGSNDNSGEICDYWAKKDGRIKVIHKQNAGLGYARNSGLEVAKGKYVSFVDSDDYIEENMYEIMYSKMKKSGADTCLCGHIKVYGDKKTEERKVCGDRVFKDNEVVSQVVLGMIGNLPEAAKDFEFEMCVWQGLFSMNIINENKVRFHSERTFISEDFIFNLDYYKHSKTVATVSECLYYYCENKKSLTKSFKADRFEKEVILYKEVFKRTEKMGFQAKERLDRNFLGRTRTYLVSVVKNENIMKSFKIIKKTASCEILENIFKYYPVNNMVFKYRIFNKFLMKKNILGLILYINIMILRDNILR